MITDDLVEFLISKQGQRVAVRFDPKSPVWTPEQKMELPPKSTIIKMDKYLSAKSFMPAAIANKEYLFAALFSFHDTGDLYLMLSGVYPSEWDVPEMGPDDEFMSPPKSLQVPALQDSGYSFGQPGKVIDIAFFNWDMTIANVLGHSPYSIQDYNNSGISRLFKWSPSTGKWREQISMSRIKTFTDQCLKQASGGMTSSQMMAWVMHTKLLDYPIYVYWDHVGKMMNQNIKDFKHADVQSVGWKQIQDLMVVMIEDKPYPVKAVPMFSNFLAGTKSTAQLASKKNDFEKFKHDSWHVYNIPDAGIRSEDGIDLIEQFDNFLVDLIKKGG